MKIISILSIISLAMFGCKFEKSTEFTLYSTPSQANSTTAPRLDHVYFTPQGDSALVKLIAKAGTFKSNGDGANIIYGLVRCNGGDWDTLQVDSIGANYQVSATIALPTRPPNPVCDTKVVDFFGRSDSLFGVAVPPPGIHIGRFYSTLCGSVPTCMLNMDQPGSSSLSQANSSSSISTSLSSSIPLSSSSLQVSSSAQSSSIAPSSSSLPQSSSAVVLITYGSMTDDRDSRVYKTVVIGTQTWMAENLDYGTRINGTATGSNQSNNTIFEKYCYGDDVTKCATNGGLYQWAEAMGIPPSCNTFACLANSGNHKGICPTTWHLPKPAEWDILVAYLGSANGGTKMKTISGWTVNPGSNSSGFSGLPAGYRYSTGGFGDEGTGAYFWEANGSDATNAGTRYLDVSNSILNANTNKTSGYSVRCVKD